MRISVEYIAGFFDGEGCIGIYYSSAGRRRKDGTKSAVYRLSVSLGQTDPAVIRHLKDQFGGTVSFYERSKKNPNRLDAWYWYITSKRAGDFLRAIEPYVIGKRQQLLLALEFQNQKLPAGEAHRDSGVRDRGREYSQQLKAMKRMNVSEQVAQ